MKMSFFLLAFLICCHQAGAAAPVHGDFAYGLPLPVVDDHGVYSLTLPTVVYEKIVREDLGDLRVFNGSGETVPHAIRRAQGNSEIKETKQPVPFFPLPDKQQPAASDLSLKVIRNAVGAVVTVDAGNVTTSPPSPLSSYLLDTTKLTTIPTELELLWDGGADAVFAVTLAQSSDLSHWSPLVGKAVLADLHYNGSSITTRRITLPRKTLPYIRLYCLDCREPLLLRAINAVTGTVVTAEQWRWLRLNAEKVREEKGELIYEYRLDAKPTMTALQLEFAQANSLVRAVIESRPSTDTGWTFRAQGNFYNLTLQDKPLVNPFLHCMPTSDRLWRLRVAADGAGFGGSKQAPQLALGWQEEQLVFVSRGRGPYTLAFGNAKLAEISTAQDNLVLAAMRDTGSESMIQRIAPGPLQTLGGEQALHPQLSAASWKKVLLWAVLLAGVAMLALMARTIYREMQAKNS